MPYKDPIERKDYQRQWKRRHRLNPSNRSRENQRRYERRQLRPSKPVEYQFVGVDTEGWTDRDGHHHCMCVIVGDRVLYLDRPLTSNDVLPWMLDLPKGPTYVSYYFDYDVTMLLREMILDGPTKAKGLFIDPYSHYVNWSRWNGYDIGIRYIPRKQFRLVNDHGDNIIIHDVGSFFQTSFVNALGEHHIGTDEQRTYIAAMKDKRADFDIANVEAIIAYSKLECQLLADLIAKLQDDYMRVGLNAYPFEGPGPVANKALTRHIGRDHSSLVPDEIALRARQSYYGGRFEIAYHGNYLGDIHEYDIRSAYPYAMLNLPCLRHCEWEHRSRSFYHGDQLWVGHVQWHYDLGYRDYGPLPFRLPQGHILYPMAGQGWYWSPEIPTDVRIHEQWICHRGCDCQPFEWINEWYQLRRSIEQSEGKGAGIALKLTLNSLYGKMAQRVGKATHFNPVWSSLITSITRAMIYRVYIDNPGKVVMFATDAVFTTEPCDLPLGNQLGEWEHAGPYQDVCIFQPGVYFDGNEAKFKTRGIPKRTLIADAALFREAANDFDLDVPMILNTHQGIRLTLNSLGPNHYRTLGDWIERKRLYNASPYKKRQPTLLDRWSKPWPGNMTAESTPYEHGSIIEGLDTMLNEQSNEYDGTYEGDL